MVHDTAMSDTPAIHGGRLRAQREAHGVEQQELAARLRHHRNTIARWERDPAVDVRRQRLYLGALRQLLEEMP
jgi:transcriptional regulator with XRE-family HTH domain